MRSPLPRGSFGRDYTGAPVQIRDDARPMALRCGHRRPPERRQEHALQRAHRLADRRARTTPSARSSRTPASCRCPTRGSPSSTALVHSERIVPATVEFVDIAGLVRGASQGEGLGNKFLAHIRETAAIVHVVRCFEDPDVVHVDGAADPLRDVETIETELVLADLDTAEKRADRARKVGKSGDKEAQARAARSSRSSSRTSRTGKPARTVEVPDAQAQGLPRVLASDRQAGALLRQRRRVRARRGQRALAGARDARALDRRRLRAHLREGRGGARRARRRRARGVPRGARRATRAASRRLIREALPAARPDLVLHRRARRRSAPGRSGAARRRRRPPPRSTPTSSAASSAPR